MRKKIFDNMIKLGFERVVLRPNGVICEMASRQLVQIIIIKDYCAIITDHELCGIMEPGWNDYEDIVWKIMPVAPVANVVRQVQELIW